MPEDPEQTIVRDILAVEEMSEAEAGEIARGHLLLCKLDKAETVAELRDILRQVVWRQSMPKDGLSLAVTKVLDRHG